jgi:hypothetical protein
MHVSLAFPIFCKTKKSQKKRGVDCDIFNQTATVLQKQESEKSSLSLAH